MLHLVSYVIHCFIRLLIKSVLICIIVWIYMYWLYNIWYNTCDVVHYSTSWIVSGNKKTSHLGKTKGQKQSILVSSAQISSTSRIKIQQKSHLGEVALWQFLLDIRVLNIPHREITWMKTCEVFQVFSQILACVEMLFRKNYDCACKCRTNWEGKTLEVLPPPSKGTNYVGSR